MSDMGTKAAARPIEAEQGRRVSRPTPVQQRYLRRGIEQPGGKLPLFDENGQEFDPRTIRSCIDQGWAAPWFANPTKPDWLICKLTDLGRAVLSPQD